MSESINPRLAGGLIIGCCFFGRSRIQLSQEIRTSVVNRLPTPETVDFFRLCRSLAGREQRYNTRKGKAVHRVDAGSSLPAARISLTTKPHRTGVVNMNTKTATVFSLARKAA